MKICILDRNPKIADDKMKIVRPWMPKPKGENGPGPSSYPTRKYVYSLEVSAYYYIKKYYKHIDIDLIQWESITNKTIMDKYDKILIFNHGLSDAMPFWKNKTEKYMKAWAALGNRAWPSFQFASFVLDKCQYYKYLSENNIVTADTYCVSSTNNLPKLKKFLDSKNINKIFIKPVGGNSGVGTSTHTRPFNNLKETLHTRFVNNNWKKLVVQRYMNFSTHDSPEYKCLYVGGKMMYIVKTFRLGYFNGMIFPTNNWWPHTKKLDKLCKKVIKLFEKKMKTKIPYCRVDWGYDRKNKRFFLNEFEHAGGTYGEDSVHQRKFLNERNWKVDIELAKAIVKFIKSLKRGSSASIKQPSRIKKKYVKL